MNQETNTIMITLFISLGVLLVGGLVVVPTLPIYNALAAEKTVDTNFSDSATYPNFGLCQPGDTATFRTVGHLTIWDNGHLTLTSDLFLTVVSTDGRNIGGGHSTFSESADFTPSSGANGVTFTGNVIEHCVEQGIIHHEHAGYTFKVLPDGTIHITYHGPQLIG
jgi:hypothetical protein